MWLTKLFVVPSLVAAIAGCGDMPAPDPVGGGRGDGGHGVVSGGPAGDHAPARTAAFPAELDDGVCVDASLSMDVGLVHQTLADVAATARDWVGPEVGDGRAGYRGRRGLNLQVRQIGRRSFDYNNALVSGRVRGVPPVLPRPDVTDADFVTKDRAWHGAVNSARRAEAAARHEAREVAARVRTASPTRERSDIRGCIAAFAQGSLPLGRLRLAVVSDLGQNVASQLVGDLRGAVVLIVHPCKAADRCAAQQKAWGRSLRALGANEVRFVRPERMDDVLPKFLQGV